MVPTDQAKVFVHLLPSLIPPGSLRGGVAVVVDVLRATTVMVHALAAGCEAVIPCGEIDEAKAIAASLPPGTALLAGERRACRSRDSTWATRRATSPRRSARERRW